MGRRGYPPEFRRPVLDLLAVGRRVTDLARNLGVSDQFGLGFTDPPLGCRELRPLSGSVPERNRGARALSQDSLLISLSEAVSGNLPRCFLPPLSTGWPASLLTNVPQRPRHPGPCCAWLRQGRARPPLW